MAYTEVTEVDSMAFFDKKEPAWIQESHLFGADRYVCSVCGFESQKIRKKCPKCATVIRKKINKGISTEELIIADILFDD